MSTADPAGAAALRRTLLGPHVSNRSDEYFRAVLRDANAITAPPTRATLASTSTPTTGWMVAMRRSCYTFAFPQLVGPGSADKPIGFDHFRNVLIAPFLGSADPPTVLRNVNAIRNP